MDIVLQWIEHHPGLAAWLQAVFSVLAIATAVYVPFRQRQHEQRDRDRDYWSDKRYQANRLRAIATEILVFIRLVREGTRRSLTATKMFQFDIKGHARLLQHISNLQNMRFGIPELLVLERLKDLLDQLDSEFSYRSVAIEEGSPDEYSAIEPMVVEANAIVDDVVTLIDVSLREVERTGK